MMGPVSRAAFGVVLATGLAVLAGHAVHAAGTAVQAAPCGAFTMNLQRELGLIAQSGLMIGATARADAAPVAPRDRGLTVTLVRQGTVTFPQPPVSKRGGPDSYAGLVSLGTLPKGEWRISANLPVWLDVVSGGRHLESPTFEMQAGCRELRKSVVFAQPADAIALLQISGGTEPTVRIVVTPHVR